MTGCHSIGLLARMQRGLERLYRIETDVDVHDYVIDAATRDALYAGRAAQEQLLLAEENGELRLALFLDERVLANLVANDPSARLDDRNLQDFLLTVEGVSHFVYVVWRALRQRPVSVLELELQAEVDKYVTCLLTSWPRGAKANRELRERLFDRFTLAADLDAPERERYLLASTSARAYAASLEERYVGRGDVSGMLHELRWFYRLGTQGKLAHMGAA